MQRILAIAVGLNPANAAPMLWRNIVANQQVPIRPYVKGLIDGLMDLEMTPGQDFEIDYATCDPGGLKKFVQNTAGDIRPDAIFAMSTTAVKAAMAASKTIPIVFPSISDPVDDGVVKSCAVPGKNATGIQAMRRQTADECLELFKATVPSLKTIFGMHKPNYGPATRAYRSVRQAARRVRVTFTPLIVRSQKDIVNILSAMSPVVGKQGPKHGVLVMPDDLALSAWPKIGEICTDRKIPNFFPVTDWVSTTAPSVMAGFGIPQYACGKQAAAYMYKVLHGVQAKILPVKHGGGFEWAVNKTLALQMGITVPASVLSAADRVI